MSQNPTTTTNFLALGSSHDRLWSLKVKPLLYSKIIVGLDQKAGSLAGNQFYMNR